MNLECTRSLRCRNFLLGLLALLVAVPAFPATAVKFPAPRPPSNDVKVENMVPIRMRDGVTLYAVVYRPAKEGKYPVLIKRTPYSPQRFPAVYKVAVFFSERGYVFVYEDVRGRFESEGKWEPFRHEMEDGYDTVEWAAKQPWSNGKVAFEGESYPGLDQWLAAKAVPPHLTTMFPGLAATSVYNEYLTLNGAWRLSFDYGWGAIRMESRIMDNVGPYESKDGPPGLSYDTVLWHLPLINMPELLGSHPQFYKDWIHHPDYDNYWKSLNSADAFPKLSIPVYTMGGWFDIFLQGTLRGYMGMREKGKTAVAREQSHMIVGPWGHGSTQKFGDLDFGSAAHVNVEAIELRWYDHWLKGMDTGIENEPPVTLFVMGKNVWRYENEYPLARTLYKKMYFNSNGNANSSRGDGDLSWDAPQGDSKPDRYRYDPNFPVPTLGGNNCCGTPTLAGPRDQHAVESRNDVLVYTSDYLKQDIEVTGPVKVVLHAASNCVDTDFIARLVDVHPDGRAYNLAEGLLRARYRNGLSNPKPLEPGKIYEMTIDLIGTSNVFLTGHRIRVDITSSDFPQFNRNPNTGEAFGMSADVKIANQVIYHSRNYPSYIVLPVIP